MQIYMAGSLFKPMHRSARRITGLVLMAAGAVAAVAQNEENSERADAPPRFSVPGGIQTNAVVLRLTAVASSTVIRYTVDGSEPGLSSLVYGEPVTLTNSILIKARGFASNAPPSATVSQAYTFLDPGLLDFHSNLPLVVLSTFGQEVPHDRKVTVSASFISPSGGRSSLAGPADFDGRAFLNVRGRASLRYPKHSYHLKTIDDTEEAARVGLLGFPKDSDWVLYAPYPDKTLMRDVLAYELSNQIGRYAARAKFVEVFVNESGGRLSQRDYVGVCVLEEKLKRGKQRVDIEKLNPADLTEPAITGGYIFKKDHQDKGEMAQGNLAGFAGISTSNRVGFPTGPGGFPASPDGFLPAYQSPAADREAVPSNRARVAGSRAGAITNHLGVPANRDIMSSSRGRGFIDDEGLFSTLEGFRTLLQTNQFYFVEPGPDEINAVQKAWLKRHVNQFESVLYGPGFKDPTNGYAAYIDPESFIDYHLIVEVSKNVDGFRFSTFFQKDRGGKIKLEPIWDWNLSFGNANGKQGWIPEYWLWPQLDDQQYSWFRRLFEDPDFGQKYVDRWGQLRTNIFAASNLLARVDELAALLDEAQARNFERWPILGREVYPNWYVGNTYTEEIAWMKQWIKSRIAWIDQQFLPPPALALEESSPGAEIRLHMVVPVGKAFYTTDGTDPRQPGGAVSTQARLYSSPIALSENAQVFARVQLGARWSSPAIFKRAARNRNS